MTFAQLRARLHAAEAKVARYEAPLGWVELQHRDCRRATSQGEFHPSRASVGDSAPTIAEVLGPEWVSHGN